jgi:hypothetical protein
LQITIDSVHDNQKIENAKTYASLSLGIIVDENEPKPVFTPYTTIKTNNVANTFH